MKAKLFTDLKLSESFKIIYTSLQIIDTSDLKGTSGGVTVSKLD